MMIEGSTLVSDCHEAVIYMEGTEYHCMKCMKRCQSAGTFSEVTERRNATPKERARLEREVVEAAKKWHAEPLGQEKIALHRTVEKLLEFEDN